MNKLHKDQSGIAHLLLIMVFVVALAGVSAFAYTRISADKAAETAASEQVEGDNEELAANDESDESDSLEKIDAEAEKEASSAQ